MPLRVAHEGIKEPLPFPKGALGANKQSKAQPPEKSTAAAGQGNRRHRCAIGWIGQITPDTFGNRAASSPVGSELDVFKCDLDGDSLVCNLRSFVLLGGDGGL